MGLIEKENGRRFRKLSETYVNNVGLALDFVRANFVIQVKRNGSGSSVTCRKDPEYV